MAKNKDRTEIEYLRGIIKKLEAENRRLKKVSGANTKKLANLDDIEDDVEEEQKQEVKIKNLFQEQQCPECNRTLEVIELGARKMHTCACGYRKTVKA